ncbi:MAG: signal recognition particle-docking protein FtsY [Myxococcota bacterium]
MEWSTLAAISAGVVVVCVVLLRQWWLRREFADVVAEAAALKRERKAERAGDASWGTALAQTRGRLGGRLRQLVGKVVADDQLWRQLEEVLVTSDVGIQTTQHLLACLRRDVSAVSPDRRHVIQVLQKRMLQMLCRAEEKHRRPEASSTNTPRVLLFVGVNGAGKTTTIGKLACRLVREGKSVVVAAGDTFRAGACEQLEAWARRAGAVFVGKEHKADPSSVLYDAVSRAKSVGADVVLCDTAGRLQSRQGLMDQLGKMHRALGKALPGAPHESFIVLDATIGQNALAQARQFAQATPLTGAVLTKLDGTAKGGVVVGVAGELEIPVRYVGLGEGVDDLRPFDPLRFVTALFGESEPLAVEAESRDRRQVQVEKKPVEQTA